MKRTRKSVKKGKKKKQKETPTATSTFWGIKNFPCKLRRKFVAMCHERGETAGNTLEYLISKWIREQKRKEKVY